LTQQLHKEEIYVQIQESDNAEQTAELIKQIAQHEIAKSILEFLENELNLIKNETTRKRSIKGKRLIAGWDNDYLINILKKLDTFALRRNMNVLIIR